MAHKGLRAVFVDCETGDLLDKLVKSEQERIGYPVTIKSVVCKAIVWYADIRLPGTKETTHETNDGGKTWHYKR